MIIYYVLILLPFFGCGGNYDLITVKSPDSKIEIILKNNLEETKYSVNYRGREIIADSKLGLIFREGLHFPMKHSISRQIYREEREKWEMPWGESKNIESNFNESTVVFKDVNGFENGSITFRAFNDGIAFRYHLKNRKNIIDSLVLINEITEFKLVEDAEAWWTPAYTKNRYEHLYENTKVSVMDTSHTPLTLRYKNGIHLSLHEASLVDYSSMQLYSNKTTLVCDLAPWRNGDKVRAELPLETPWRTIVIVEEAKDLISSNLILNCNEPSVLEDVSWIKPSKYIGIWWGMIIGKWTWGEGLRHGATNDRAKKYIDFASENNFDEVLIEGWASGWESLFPKDSVIVSFTQSTPDFDLAMIQEYAQSKNISLKAYHETMANTKNYLSQIDSAFSLLNKLGIKNVKIGHVGSMLDKKEYHYGQYGVNYYRTVLKKALKHKLGVNFHEPIKDTGERRTYPNMLTREGARGNEFNAWQNGNPPSHTLILPFTRLLSSPMDFTPGIFDLLYENIDINNSEEFITEFTFVDSGNGYENVRYKGSESLWFEKDMKLVKAGDDKNRINIWRLDEPLQYGDWEWGIVADNPSINKFNIWILETLPDSENRRLIVDKNGQTTGASTIVAPNYNLHGSNKPSIMGYPPLKPQRVNTTLSKQLGLYVIIHSPLQMASDFIENYDGNPAFQFIRDVPVTWDTTVVINGEVEDFLTIARKDRNSFDWYLGAITDEEPRSFAISLGFLGDGSYRASIYADSDSTDWIFNPSAYTITEKFVSKDTVINISLASGGGQAIRFKHIP